MYNFQKFEKNKHQLRRTPKLFISVCKQLTRISFSYPLTEWLLSNDIKNVDFLFDFGEGEIAFQAADKKAYTVQCRQKSQAYVSAKGFLRFLEKVVSGRYVAGIDDINKRIICKIPLIKKEEK